MYKNLDNYVKWTKQTKNNPNIFIEEFPFVLDMVMKVLLSRADVKLSKHVAVLHERHL